MRTGKTLEKGSKINQRSRTTLVSGKRYSAWKSDNFDSIKKVKNICGTDCVNRN